MPMIAATRTPSIEAHSANLSRPTLVVKILKDAELEQNIIDHVPVFLFKVVKHPTQKDVILKVLASFLLHYSVVCADSWVKREVMLPMKSLIVLLVW